jgi:hypothetical protein
MAKNTSKEYAVNINSNEISSKITGFRCESYQDKKVEWSYDFTQNGSGGEHDELPTMYYTNNGELGARYKIWNIPHPPTLPDIYYAEKDPANWLLYYKNKFCNGHYTYCEPGTEKTSQSNKNSLTELVSQYKLAQDYKPPSTGYKTVDDLNISFEQDNILTTLDCSINN